VARDLVPAALDARGARVDVVEAYRTVAPPDLADRARQVFSGQDRPDWVTFTSSSTVSNLVQAAGAHALEGVRIASIGPVTSATLLRHGLTVAIEASPYTVEGLVDAILRTESA
jgi:uroporphyrinogen-III synthase